MKYQTLPVTHYQQNCSVIWCERSRAAAIVDPGGEVSRIIEFLEREALKPEQILLTHGHLDHVGGTEELARLLELPIIGPHRDDAFWINALDTQAQMMGFPKVSGFLPERWLQHGDVVELGELRLDVLHCPGHTPGHVVFYNAAAKLAFVGDVLFQGSIGRSDFPRGNFEDLVHSIRAHLFPLGDDVRFVPGHGPESTFGHERRHNPFVADARFG